MKNQAEFNTYIIEEITKLIYRYQTLEKEVNELKNNSSNYDFWFNNYKKEMEIDKND